MKLKLPILILVLLVASVATYKWWNSAPVGRHVAKEILPTAQPLLSSLKEFRDVNGRFPKSLDELVPNYLTAIPSPAVGYANLDSKWHYTLMDSGHFQLHTTFMHWVSTYDVLVLRSDGNYPRSWNDQAQILEHKEWKHLVGAQNVSGF